MALAIDTPTITLLLLQAIETHLWLIMPTNGYYTEVRTVTRGIIHPSMIQSFPSISIVPSQDDPEEGAHSIHRRQLSLLLRLWVRPHTNLSDELEMLKGDVQRHMKVDERWIIDGYPQGLAVKTVEGATQYVYLETNEIEAGADITYTIHYRTDARDPRVISG